MREVERRLFQLHGDDAIFEGDKNLDFGYQNRVTIFNTKDSSSSVGLMQKQKTLLSGIKVDSPMAIDDSTLEDNALAAASDSYLFSSPNESTSPTDSFISEREIIDVAKPLKSSLLLEERGIGLRNVVDERSGEFSPIESSSMASVSESSTESSSKIIAIPATRPIETPSLLASEDNGDGVDLSRIFASNGIARLGERSLDFHASETYKYCWLYAKGYRYSSLLFKVS